MRERSYLVEGGDTASTSVLAKFMAEFGVDPDGLSDMKRVAREIMGMDKDSLSVAVGEKDAEGAADKIQKAPLRAYGIFQKKARMLSGLVAKNIREYGDEFLLPMFFLYADRLVGRKIAVKIFNKYFDQKLTASTSWIKGLDQVISEA